MGILTVAALVGAISARAHVSLEVPIKTPLQVPAKTSVPDLPKRKVGGAVAIPQNFLIPAYLRSQFLRKQVFYPAFVTKFLAMENSFSDPAAIPPAYVNFIDFNYFMQKRGGVCDAEINVIRECNAVGWSNSYIFGIGIYPYNFPWDKGSEREILTPKPSSIGFDGGEVGLLERKNGADQAGDSYESSEYGAENGDAVQPFLQAKLTAPIVTLVGLVAAFMGWRLSERGLVRGPFSALMGGWIIAVTGGACALLGITGALISAVFRS